MKYIPKLNTPGMSSFERFYTYSEVFEQIVRTLKATHIKNEDCSAYGLAEWCSERSSVFKDNPVNGGSLEVVVRFGNNEGLIIDVMHLNPDDQANTSKTIASLKYLAGSDDCIWGIGQMLTKSIYAGSYA
jgi:hypothetical protein